MDELISQINPIKYNKTYPKPQVASNFRTNIKRNLKPSEFNFNEDNRTVKLEENDEKVLDKDESNLERKNPLTTKDAVKYLVEGILKEKVCRYCLNTSLELSNLDELITIARNGTLFSIAIKQMIASFHPVKINDDPNFPTKICQTCIDHTINSYLFAQQCDQSERALQNCFEDMYDKVLKLDPLERTKRRGRYKLKPNYNKLHTEHKYVINYAEPTIHINSTAIQLPNEPKINNLECLKCSQVFPDTISLLNHVKTHSKSQWFNCRLCGKSFPKLFHLKRHFREFHSMKNTIIDKIDETFKCNDCSNISENYQQFYQHKEKHKFRMVMKHLISCKMDKLCTICMDKGSHMTDIDQYVNLHGGFPELTGDKSVLSMAAATLPERNYKYQELLVARNANKITIRKKNISKTSPIFILSQPIVVTLENIKVNDEFIYLFNSPRKMNDENDSKEPEAKKIRYKNTDENIPMNLENLNENTLVDSNKNEKYIYTFSNPIEISKIDDLAEESIKKSCKECWIFQSFCAKCDGSIKFDSKIKCNQCWIFKNLDKCENCKMYIEKVEKDKNTADGNKDTEAVKDEKNTLKYTLFDKTKLWKCAVCLTNNKSERESCFCCESKTYKDTTKFNFNNIKSYGFLDNSKKDTLIKILDKSNTDKDSSINGDQLCSTNVNIPTILAKVEGNISKNKPENTANGDHFTTLTNFERIFPGNTFQTTNYKIEMDTESTDCANFKTFETKLEDQNWELKPNRPQTIESMEIEEMSMDPVNMDQKSDCPQALITDFKNILTQPVQFAIGFGEKIITKRPFRKVARACHK